MGRMTCHCFQWPIRRDLRISCYTTGNYWMVLGMITGRPPSVSPPGWPLINAGLIVILHIIPQADHPLLVGAVVDWNLSNDLLLFIEEIHMNNMVAIICSKIQNLKQIFQYKFEENVNWVMCHVFFTLLCCFKSYFAKWMFDLGG